jgi:hypothetical protein
MARGWVGVVVFKYFKGRLGLPLVAVMASIPAKSENLHLPYTCSVEQGEVRLHPGIETSFRILGKRDDQIFTICPAGQAATCTNMMIHRFAVMCGSERISWARIAHSAHKLGIDMPKELPTGFAPVAPLGGRFVLPALAPANLSETRVTTQELSPDGVIDHGFDTPSTIAASWTTIVQSNVNSQAGAGVARVAAAVAALMLALLTVAYVAAGRARIVVVDAEYLRRFFHVSKKSAGGLSKVWTVMSATCAEFYAEYRRAPTDENIISEAFASAHANLADVELAVAALPADLLLRDVLSSELKRLSRRLQALEKGHGRKPPEETNSQIRHFMREIDRISKIAKSAVQIGGATREDEGAIPQSVGEAYYVLGLNRNAAPEIAKKLVDALRLNWHPDYAQDEADRSRRENRIKQINAAWDIVSGRREAA